VILLGAFAQGAALLRATIPRLPEPVKEAIAGIDLIEDPTADRQVDATLDRPSARPDGQDVYTGIRNQTWPSNGIATVAGRLTDDRFRQPRYVGHYHVAQWCRPGDLVCDTARGRSLTPQSHYQWTEIGRRSVSWLPALLPLKLIGLQATYAAPAPPDTEPIATNLCGPPPGVLYTVDHNMTLTDSQPSHGAWTPSAQVTLTTHWRGDRLTLARSGGFNVRSPSGESLELVVRTPGDGCQPLAIETSPIGPAIPVDVVNEVYGTGRSPAFSGCGYLSVSSSPPRTITLLITDGNYARTHQPGSLTCQHGELLPP